MLKGEWEREWKRENPRDQDKRVAKREVKRKEIKVEAPHFCSTMQMTHNLVNETRVKEMTSDYDLTFFFLCFLRLSQRLSVLRELRDVPAGRSGEWVRVKVIVRIMMRIMLRIVMKIMEPTGSLSRTESAKERITEWGKRWWIHALVLWLENAVTSDTSTVKNRLHLVIHDRVLGQFFDHRREKAAEVLA